MMAEKLDFLDEKEPETIMLVAGMLNGAQKKKKKERKLAGTKKAVDIEEVINMSIPSELVKEYMKSYGISISSMLISGNISEAIKVSTECAICTHRLLGNGNSGEFYFIRCHASEKHIFHTKCYLNEGYHMKECPRCRMERSLATPNILLSFLNSMVSTETDYMDYATKAALFRYWDSMGRKSIAKMCNLLDFTLDELRLLQSKVTDLAVSDDFSDLLAVLASNISLQTILQLNNTKFCEYMLSSKKIPLEVLEIRLTEQFLSGTNKPPLLEIIEALTESGCPKKTEFARRGLDFLVVGEDLDQVDIQQLLKAFIRNNRCHLIKMMLVKVCRRVEFGFYEVMDMVLLYMSEHSSEESLVWLLCYLFKNCSILRSQVFEIYSCNSRTENDIGEEIEDKPINPRIKQLLDFSKHSDQEKITRFRSFMKEKRSENNLFLVEIVNILERTPGDEIKGLFKAFVSTWKHGDDLLYYAIFPGDKISLEDDMNFLKILVEHRQDSLVYDVLMVIIQRHYYDSDSFLTVFETIAKSRYKCYIHTLLSITHPNIVRGLQSSKKVEVVVNRLINIGLYWSIFYLENYVDNQQAHDKVLECCHDKIMAMYYDRSGALYNIPDILYVPSIHSLKYSPFFDFNYLYFPDLLKCVFETKVPRRKIEQLLKEICGDSSFEKCVTVDKMETIFSLIYQQEECIFFLRSCLAALGSSRLAQAMKAEILKSIVSDEGLHYPESLYDKDLRISNYFIGKICTMMRLGDNPKCYEPWGNSNSKEISSAFDKVPVDQFVNLLRDSMIRRKKMQYI